MVSAPSSARLAESGPPTSSPRSKISSGGESWASSSPPSTRGSIDRATGKRIKKVARDTKWKARYTDPIGKDRRKTFTRKADAEKFLERIGTHMQKGDWIDPEGDKSRFDDWVDVWWKTTIKLAPSTRRGYDKILRLYLRPRFSGRKINSIDWVEVELIRHLAARTGPQPEESSRDDLRSRSIMKTAMKARVIRENPAAGHSMPSKRKRTQVLTMQQVDLLVEHTDERYRSAVWLLALAGLRPLSSAGFG